LRIDSVGKGTKKYLNSFGFIRKIIYLCKTFFNRKPYKDEQIVDNLIVHTTHQQCFRPDGQRSGLSCGEDSDY
jgi:hypothetical protein